MARPGRLIADLGADFDHFAFGMRGFGLATEPNYVIRRNDVLFVDFGCVNQYYFSDSGTTLAPGEPARELRDRHIAVRACMEVGIEVRPGIKSSVVEEVMWQALLELGITVSFPHGHGLGLEIREYPIIVADNGLCIRDDCIDVPSAIPLGAGMVVNLEAPIFVAGVGSVHTEESLLITVDGCESLVTQERSIPVQPPAN